MTFYNKVNTTGTPTSGQILVATDAHDASWQANNSTSGTWTTGFDVDFTAQTTANPVTDSSYAFTGVGSNPGGTFQAINSINIDGTHVSFLINGVGWQTTPTNSGSGRSGTYSGHNCPAFRIGLTSINANITQSTPLRIWLYASGETQLIQSNGGNGEGQFIAIDDWYDNAYNWSLYGSRSANASSFAYNAGFISRTGGGSQNSNAPFIPAPDVFMLYLPYGTGGRQAYVYKRPPIAVGSPIALTGTFSVADGSNGVTASTSQTGLLFANELISFASQPGFFYTISSVSGTSITLTSNFSGTSNGATTANATATFGPTNGSVTVTTSRTQVGTLAPGNHIIFGAQSNVYYVIDGVTSSGISITSAYNGSTSTTSIGSIRGSSINLSGTFTVTANSTSVTTSTSQVGIVNPGDQIIFNAHPIGTSGTFNVQNGNASVTATNSQTGTLGPGVRITFDGGTTYWTIATVSGTAITLTTTYGGSTNATASASYLTPTNVGVPSAYQFMVAAVNSTTITLSTETPFIGSVGGTISGVTAVSQPKLSNWPSLPTMIPVSIDDIGSTQFDSSINLTYQPASSQYIFFGCPGVPGDGGFNGQVGTIARIRMDYVQGQ